MLSGVETRLTNARVYGYVRVSTGEQGRSGLGLSAQRAAIESYAQGRRWLDVEFREEIASGARDDRPVLVSLLSSLRSGDTLRDRQTPRVHVLRRQVRDSLLAERARCFAEQPAQLRDRHRFGLMQFQMPSTNSASVVAPPRPGPT